MEIGRQIRMYRQRDQLSQEELAGKIYVSRQTISNWENNRSYPDIQNLMLLSVLFNVSLDELVNEDVDVMKKRNRQEKLEQIWIYHVGCIDAWTVSHSTCFKI